jgi:parallel beta-helix repeat protein
VLAALLALGGAFSVATPIARAADAGPWQFNPGTGHFYQVVLGQTWLDAEAYAQSVGGHLVTINDQAEEAWLEATFPDQDLWIGLTDQATEGTWVWASGEAVTYSHWCAGQPDDWKQVGGEDYGFLNVGFCGAPGWDDADGGAMDGIVEVAYGNAELSTSTTLAADVTGTISIAADGITLDCAGHEVVGSGQDTGIMLDGRTGVTVKNCRVSGFANGIRLVNWTGPSSQNTLLGNTVTASDAIGIVVIGSSGDVLTGNAASNSAYGDLVVIDSAAETLTANTATRGGWYGIMLQRSSGNTLRGNHAHDNGTNGGGTAILVTDDSNANLLVGNDASNNDQPGSGVDGIRVNNSRDNVVRGNTANGNATWGFMISSYPDVGSSGNVLTGNTANGNAIIGFALNLAAGNSLSANTAAGNGQTGFDILGGGSNRLLNNTATVNAIGISVANSHDNVVTGNRSRDNRDGGIVVNASTDGRLTGNTISGNGGAGLWVGNTSGLLVTGNTATTNHSDGFVIVDATGGRLTGNTATSNGDGSHGGNGFVLARTTGLVMSGNAATDSPWACVGLYDAHDTTVSANTASGCSAGFDLSDGSTGNTLRNNTANGNGYRGGLGNGFSLELASSNLLAGNTANGNNDGFNLCDGAAGNTLTGNTANRNTDFGFVVWAGFNGPPPQDNTFTANAAHGNATLDAYEDGSSTGDVWSGNRFGTHAGF